MNSTPPLSTLSEKIVVRSTNFALPDEVRAAALEQASRLFAHHPKIDRIRIDFECDAARTPTDRFVAKGQVEFGGPALLASVSTDTPANSLEHLVAKFDHLLHRRRSR